MSTGESSDYLVQLRVDLNNKSAIKALKELSGQSDETTDEVKDGTDEASDSMDRMAKRTGLLRDAFTNLIGMVGIAGVGFGLKDVISDGEQLQAQQTQLQAALKATGQTAGDMGSKMEAFAENLSEHGGQYGGSTTANLAALTQFTRETRSASEAQKMLSLSTNISNATGKSLATTQSLVAKAYDGSAGKLQALLGPMVASKAASVGLTLAHEKEVASIQETASMMSGPAKTAYVAQMEINDHLTAQQMELASLDDKRATASEALAAATKYFAGSTADSNKSVQGQEEDLEHTVHNLAESLGTALLPAVDKIVHGGADLAEVMAHNKKAVMIVVGAVTALTAAWGAHKVVGGIVREYQQLRSDLVAVGTRFGILKTQAQQSSVGQTEAAETSAHAQTAAATEATAVVDREQQAAAANSIEAWSAFADESGADMARFATVADASLDTVGASSLAAGELAADGAAVATAGWEGFMDATIIGLVFVGLEELVTHWRLVEHVAVEAWEGIEIGAKAAAGWVLGAWHTVESFFGGLWHGFEHDAGDAFNLLKRVAKDALGDIKTLFNDSPLGGMFNFGKNLAGGHIGSAFSGLAKGATFGLLSEGGVVPRHFYDGGSAGTDTVPAMLTPNEGVVTTEGMNMLGSDGLNELNHGMVPASLAGRGGGVSQTFQPFVLQLDGRTLLRSVIKQTLNEAARGPTSLVGGSLATGTVGY